MYRLILRQISRRKYRLPPWFSSRSHHDQGNNNTAGRGHYVPPVALASAALFTSNSNDDISINQAIKVNDYRTVREIIQMGDKESSLKYNKLGWTPLILAAAWNKTMIAKLLLDNGADPDSQDKYQPPVKQRITRNDRYFSKSDQERYDQRENDFPTQFNPQADFCGATALFYATLNNNPEMVELLLQNGADPLIKLRSGLHPLEVVNMNTENGIKIKAMLLKAITDRDEIMKEKRLKYPLESRLGENIIGQKGAINQISAAIRRKENGWVDADHPIVMIFLGSSGIGKTELAKQIAKYVHGENKDGFVRMDMSEYASQHEVARLIGAPPGYVGHDKGGQLTDALTKCPTAIVLFDEIEKAHPDALPILLGLFDEGRMTDGQGKTIECKDAIFIMTSNLAQTQIAEHALSLRSKGDQKDQIDKEFKQSVVKPILKFHFKRDEFLGRINEFVYFLPFSDSELRQLVEFQLKMWKRISLEKHSIQLDWTEDVITVLTDGYDVSYGARSVKHETERKVVSRLAKAFEDGTLKKDMKIEMCCDLPENVQDYQHVNIKLKNKETNAFL